MKLFKLLTAGVVSLLVWGCNSGKVNPVSWEDVAQTIPAEPRFVASVNTEFELDSALTAVWGKADVTALIHRGLELCTDKPDHLVVVGMPKAVFVTWPLPDPQAAAKAVEGWKTVSLNNTVDAHMLMQGKASIIVSSTQAWVINNVHGAKYLNDMLSAAMSAKAANVQPLHNCITTKPQAVTAVVPYSGRYYRLAFNHDVGQLRVDVNAVDKHDKPVHIIDGVLGTLPGDDISHLAPTSPFAAVAVDRGDLPRIIKYAAKLVDNTALRLALNAIAPVFADAAGQITAVYEYGYVKINVEFVNSEAAATAATRLNGALGKVNAGINVTSTGKKVEAIIPAPGVNIPLDAYRDIPHRHTQTSSPAIVAFARVDLRSDLPAEVYLEVTHQNARLQLDYSAGADNLAEIMLLIKQIVFKSL